MADHSDSPDVGNSPTYQTGCPQDGCRGILMYLSGQGRSVCCKCGAVCRRGDEWWYDISGAEPRRLSDDEVAELRRSA